MDCDARHLKNWPLKKRRDQSPPEPPAGPFQSRGGSSFQQLSDTAAKETSRPSPTDSRYRKSHRRCGALEEAFKWGQVSYLTSESKSGSTIRIDRVKSAPDTYAIYFHCQTNLVETFRELYPNLAYGGNRCILLDVADAFPKDALRHCVALALTYHLGKNGNRRDRA
jgi:hypothetical protein